MISIKFLYLFIFIIIAGFSFCYFYRIKSANPCFWSIFFHSNMFIGTLVLVDIKIESDIIFLNCYLLAFFFFTVSSLYFSHFYKIPRKFSQFNIRPLLTERKYRNYRISFMLIFSVLLTILYFYLVGYNLLLSILIGSDISDFATLRIQSYSPDNYLAPGYFNQFKNILLPCTFFIIGYTFKSSRNRKLYYFIFSIFLLFALLGTGQRAHFVYTSISLLFALSLLKLISLKRLIYFLCFMSIIFTAGTFMYYQSRFDINNNIQNELLLKVFSRFLFVEQEATLFSFNYFYSVDSVYLTDWFQDLRGLIPGYSGSYTEHFLFYLRHGTDRGTEGFHWIASAYYNGRYLLIILFSSFLGFFYTWLYNRLLIGRKSITRITIYSFIFFHLSFYMSGTPIALVNNGVLTLFILLLLLKLRFKPKYI